MNRSAPAIERVTFTCDGETLVGDLYRPEGPVRAAIVTSGPLTSVRTQASGAYARAMAARGFAALAFDHRYFGESSGTPRQFENPQAKIADIHAGVRWLEGRFPGAPMVAVGVCAGAGYMAEAVAQDPALKAFAGVAGYYAHPTAESLAAAAPQIARARAAEAAWRETGVAETVPAVAADGGDVGMPLREAYDYYGTDRGGTAAGYVNGFAVQSRAYTIPFDAVASAPRIDVPTLIVHSDQALAPPLARAFLASLKGPHDVLWTISRGQIDFYDDPVRINEAADAAAAHFGRHLP